MVVLRNFVCSNPSLVLGEHQYHCSLVLVLSDDPMSLILDQMSAYDALWMAFPNDEGVAWTALYKPLADGVQPAEDTVLDANQVRDMTVRSFVDDFVRPSTDGFDIEISPYGTRRTPKSSRATHRAGNAIMRADTAKWRPIIQASGFKAE